MNEEKGEYKNENKDRGQNEFLGGSPVVLLPALEFRFWKSMLCHLTTVLISDSTIILFTQNPPEVGC